LLIFQYLSNPKSAGNHARTTPCYAKTFTPGLIVAAKVTLRTNEDFTAIGFNVTM
jgi:hypothetical protein